MNAPALVLPIVLAQVFASSGKEHFMKCLNCQAENPDGARFCMTCGTPTAVACAHCGAQLMPGAKFCVNCGPPVAAAATASPAPVAPAPAEPAIVAQDPLARYIPKELAAKLEAARSGRS